MNKIIRCISLLMLLVGLSTPANAKKSTLNLKDHPSSGMNALDYILQKPLGNDTFPADEKGFGKHFFLSAGVGTSALTNTFSTPHPGLYVNGQVGSWFTPVHGIRLVGKGGMLSLQRNNGGTWFGGGQVDYLLNLSYLLRGYNPYRKFELIATVGLEGDLMRHNGIWGKQLGIGSSLQMRFNCGPSLYLYVEPRLAMVAGTRYGGIKDNPYRMKAEPSLSIGLGYRILTGKYRAMGSSPFIQTKDDNLFFGAGVGAWAPIRKVSNLGISGDVYVGKMFSSASGLQLNVAAGRRGPEGPEWSRYYTIGTLDYVLNFDNAMGGYRPGRVFNLLGNIGVGAGYAMVHNRPNTLSPAISAGLTGVFNVSPNWAITIHPQAYFSTSSFFAALNSKRPMIASVDLGLRYTIGRFSQNFPGSYADLADTKRWFITAGGGLGSRFRHSYGPGADLFVGFGRRITPVSSYRVMATGVVFPKAPCAIDFTVGVDYLSSITTAMMGFNPDRVFDLQLVLGVLGGAAEYDGPVRMAIGAKAGLQGNFRLNKHLDLFIEPHIIGSRLPIDGTYSIIPEARCNIGLTYRLGNTSGQRGHISETPYGDGRNFAGIAGGPSIYYGYATRSNLLPSGALDVNVGRWFSMVSGLRLVVSNDWCRTSSESKFYIGAVHADYLLNLTSLFDRSAERRFHILGAAGLGLAYAQNGQWPVGAAAYGGIQFRYNLPANIDLHLEAGAQAWQRRVLPAASNYGHSALVAPRLLMGASYRF